LLTRVEALHSFEKQYVCHMFR